MKLIKKAVDWLLDLSLAICLDVLIVLVCYSTYLLYFTQEAYNARVKQIYHDIIVQTGQAQDSLPLKIVYSPIDNAYTDGTAIVVYTGFIKAHKWDEIALILGHEVAHYNLGHTNAQIPVPEENSIEEMGTNGYNAVLEANADKLGAVYAMKAGYDVCEGRKIYKYWKSRGGNYQGQTHPDYSYRYDELNINCGDK